ncbi:hypothetical protein [Microbulbifer okhotskensis]|uniref:hypothetical protein n=1 Tax=Microbulbifer okhotskensis TaxID=2926617 RepID=UPI00207D503B|nr:hypothetical protein [Microbulbifer okhotskensis]
MSSKDNNLEVTEELSEVDKLLALVQHVAGTNVDSLTPDAKGGFYLLVDHARDKLRACI